MNIAKLISNIRQTLSQKERYKAIRKLLNLKNNNINALNGYENEIKANIDIKMLVEYYIKHFTDHDMNIPDGLPSLLSLLCLYGDETYVEYIIKKFNGMYTDMDIEKYNENVHQLLTQDAEYIQKSVLYYAIKGGNKDIMNKIISFIDEKKGIQLNDVYGIPIYGIIPSQFTDYSFKKNESMMYYLCALNDVEIMQAVFQLIDHYPTVHRGITLLDLLMFSYRGIFSSTPPDYLEYAAHGNMSTDVMNLFFEYLQKTVLWKKYKKSIEQMFEKHQQEAKMQLNIKKIVETYFP